MKIDFEQLYRIFIQPRLAQAQGLKGEEIEALSDQWYEEFNHTPNAELGGLVPCEYYTQFDGPMLLELAWDYWEEGEELPGQLARALAQQDEETAQAMFRLLERALPAVRGEMLELLCQMQYPPLLEAGFAKILEQTVEDEEKQLWVEAVQQFGAKAAVKALALLDTQVDEETEQILADILCHWPLEGAFERLSSLFSQAQPENRAFYASCLGKLGDERSLELLTEQLKDPKLDYYTYCAIRDAAEELGAWVELDREFAGDKDYEAIKAAMMEEEQE